MCFSRLLQLLCRLWSSAAPWGWHIGCCDARLHVVLNKALGHCPELGLQSVLHGYLVWNSQGPVPSEKLLRPASLISGTTFNITIYRKLFSNSCHLLSAWSILLSCKIPICFPSNHSKQCGTVLTGGPTQMRLLPCQKNGWLYSFLGTWDMLLCLHGGRIETRCSCPML